MSPSQKGFSLSWAGAAGTVEVAAGVSVLFPLPKSDDELDGNDIGGAGGRLRGLATNAELAKKLGMPEGPGAGFDGLTVDSLLLLFDSLDSEGVAAARGGASANERKVFGAADDWGSVPDPLDSEFSFTDDVDDSDFVTSGWPAGLPSENGREVMGGSLALVKSFCNGVASGFANENPAGILKDGSFLEASSSIAYSFRRAPSSPSIASSPSSS